MNKEFKDVREFANEIKGRLEDIYVGADIQVTEAVKNNDNLLIGLTFRNMGESLSPQVYLNDMYESFVNGKRNIDEITLLVQRVFNEQIDKPWISLDADSLRNWESIKDKVIVKLFGIENNEEYLSDAVYMPVCDNLAEVVFVMFDRQESGVLTSKLTKSLFESLNITREELFDVAIKNTMREFPAKIMGMSEMIRRITGSDEFGLSREEEILYVLSNDIMVNGAATLLYNNVLRDFCVRFGTDRVIILPSSIHEAILVLPDTLLDKDELKRMVMEINDTVLSVEDVLSNDAYIYRLEDDQIHVMK